jgi:hypothetical protein
VTINIDLAVESAQNTFDVVVKSDDADGSKAGFTVVGTMSAEFAKARREMELSGIRLARSKKGKVDWQGAEGDELIADQRAAGNLVIAKHCTVGWFGFFVGKDDPQPFEFTPENLDRVLSLFPLFADRIATEVQNEENFMPS